MSVWKVGNITLGILLVAVGVGFFVSNVYGWDSAALLLKWWPLVLIALGIEVLVYHAFAKEENRKVRHSGGSIVVIVVILALVFAWGTSWQAIRYLPDLPRIFSQGIFDGNVVQAYDLNSAEIEIIHHLPGAVRITSGQGAAHVEAKIHYNKSLRGADSFADLINVQSGRLTVGALAGGSRFNAIKVDLNIVLPENAKLKMTSDIGSIDVQDVSGDLEIVSNVGSVSLTDIAGSFDIESNVGSVNVDTQKLLTQDCRIKSDTGSVNLKLARAQAGSIKAEVKTGSLNSNVGRVKKDGLRSRLDFDFGGSPRFTVESGLGSVNIQWDNQ